ncbi:hypothetical protein G9A89_012117 [Geosiphon pyriformis]|nr:hypothetical protein G9A89_012117 [Geosiphon pyriformis]
MQTKLPSWKKHRVESPTTPSYHYIPGSAINILSADVSTSNTTSTFGRFQFQSNQQKEDLLEPYGAYFEGFKLQSPMPLGIQLLLPQPDFKAATPQTHSAAISTTESANSSATRTILATTTATTTATTATTTTKRKPNSLCTHRKVRKLYCIFQHIRPLHPANLQAAVTHARDFESAELEANHTQAVNLVINGLSDLNSKLKQISDTIN